MVVPHATGCVFGVHWFPPPHRLGTPPPPHTAGDTHPPHVRTPPHPLATGPHAFAGHVVMGTQAAPPSRVTVPPPQTFGLPPPPQIAGGEHALPQVTDAAFALPIKVPPYVTLNGGTPVKPISPAAVPWLRMLSTSVESTVDPFNVTILTVRFPTSKFNESGSVIMAVGGVIGVAPVFHN